MQKKILNIFEQLTMFSCLLKSSSKKLLVYSYNTKTTTRTIAAKPCCNYSRIFSTQPIQTDKLTNAFKTSISVRFSIYKYKIILTDPK